ncbi:hypothetical protein DFH05DRAFT_1494789 [Lentinula detonsa]|uniref:Uncharacterized protein n=1 Tax=Lentinula detonsa TaxID=2804962 RepID=A0A9W8P0M7_9AGAR|nr:hypothetical protein DFH05DRAFT_1494789 [Lentinula detonsa]
MLIPQTHPRSNQAAKDITYTRTLLRKLEPEELRAYLDVLIAMERMVLSRSPKSVSLNRGNTDVGRLEGLRLMRFIGMYDAVEMELGMNGDGVEKFRTMNEDLAEWMYNYLRNPSEPMTLVPNEPLIYEAVVFNKNIQRMHGSNIRQYPIQ